MKQALIAAVLLGCVYWLSRTQTEKPKQTATEKAQAEEIEQLKTRLAALEKTPTHHYELRSEGTRSFRFDPETGDSCIQLASKADWKLPDTIRQGCQYQDYINSPLLAGEDALTRTQWAECMYAGNQKACNALAGKPAPK